MTLKNQINPQKSESSGYVATYKDGAYFVSQSKNLDKNLFKIEVADTSIKVTVDDKATPDLFKDLQGISLDFDFTVYAFLDSGEPDDPKTNQDESLVFKIYRPI